MAVTSLVLVNGTIAFMEVVSPESNTTIDDKALLLLKGAKSMPWLLSLIDGLLHLSPDQLPLVDVQEAQKLELQAVTGIDWGTFVKWLPQIIGLLQAAKSFWDRFRGA